MDSFTDRTKRRRLNKSVKPFYAQCLSDDKSGRKKSCVSADASTNLTKNAFSLESCDNFASDESVKNNTSETKNCSLSYNLASFDANCINDDQSLDLDNESIEKLKPQLANWVAQFNIQARAVCALLEILRRQKLDLPKDYRTLMAIPINYSIKNIVGGHYYYNRIKKGFLSLLGDKNLNQVKKNSCLSLHVNVDGLPLFQSSKVQLWPILGIFREFKDLGPFVIALFSGVNNPSSIDAYLQLFIDEIKECMNMGLKFTIRD